MPEMGSGRCRRVGVKGRPLCAGVSVTPTMRQLRGEVDDNRKYSIFAVVYGNALNPFGEHIQHLDADICILAAGARGNME